MVDDVAMALERAGVPGRALMIEVTETSLVHDLTTAAEHIAQLLALGVRTSVDDFGTGYTSVSHLRRLPISEVKIRSEEHTSELQSLMRISYAVFCLKKKKKQEKTITSQDKLHN